MPAAVLQDAESVTTAWQWVTLLLAVLGEVLAVVFVLRVLSRGGSPAGTLLWMLVILLAPWLGLLLYYLFPRRLQTRRLLRRRQRLQWIEGSLADVGPRPAPVHSEAVRGDALARLLCHLDEESLHAGNRVELIATGTQFFDEVTGAIAGARRFVHLQTYIFRSDASGLRLVEVLAAAAARGVEVRLLYDGFGSWGLDRRHLEPLIRAGGRVESYLPLLWRRRPFTVNFRNHRKLVVVDGEVAWLGGRNIGEEYARDRFGRGKRLWLDAMVAVRGPAVPRLHRVFVEDWYNAADEDLAERRYFPGVPPAGRTLLGVVANGPDRNTNDLRWVLFQILAMARETVLVSTPYLIPPPVLLLALQVAAARGVRVRMHTNGVEAEQFVLYRAQRAHYRPLLEAGVELTETTGDYNHAKFAVVDDEIVFVGSANWDTRSAVLNFEIGVVTRDATLAAEAVALFEERAGEGRRVDPESLEQGPVGRIIEGACRLLSPLL